MVLFGGYSMLAKSRVPRSRAESRAAQGGEDSTGLISRKYCVVMVPW